MIFDDRIDYDSGDKEFNNMYSLVDTMRSLRSDTTDIKKSVRSFVTSPLKVELSKEQFESLTGGTKFGNVVTPSRSITPDSLSRNDKRFLTELVGSLKISRDVQDQLEDMNDNLDDIRDYSKQSADNSGTNSSTNTILKSLATAITSILGTAINTMTTRAVNDIENMINSRNDIMYQYGLKSVKDRYYDPYSGKSYTADDIYKLQFQHQAAPYQRRTAPEWQTFRRQQERAALDMGFNTEKSIQNVTNQLYKWQDIFENINFSSSQLFKTTMRFVDKSGESFNAIMSTVRESAQDYIVTPELLEEVSSSYSKYLRTITKNNNAYVKSMNNLITSVAKLEDAGVDATSYFNEIQSFMYGDITNASQTDMWTRLLILGQDPFKVLTQQTSDQALNTYTNSLKQYFSNLGLDHANGMDRLQINTIAQQVLGFSTSEMQNLYDLLLSKPSGGATGQEKTVDDYSKQIAIDFAEYKMQAESGWVYLTESQKFQDKLTLSILNNDHMLKAYEWWEETTKGVIGIEDVVETLTSFVIGGGLLSLVKSVFGGGSGGTFGFFGRRAASGAAGAAGGASKVGGTLTKLFGKGTTAGAAAPLMVAGGVIMGGVDAYNTIKGYNQLMGSDATLGGQVAHGIGGFLGGNSGYGWADDSRTTLQKIGSTLEGAAKGALIGAFAGPVGMAIGAVIGAGFAAVGGERIAEIFMSSDDLAEKRLKKTEKMIDANNDHLLSMTGELVNSQEVQYYTADELKTAMDNNTLNLSSYGLNDSNIQTIVQNYTATGDLTGSLQTYGFTEDTIAKIQAQVDSGQSLYDVLSGNTLNTNDQLRLLNENTLGILNEMGGTAGTYTDEYGISRTTYNWTPDNVDSSFNAQLKVASSSAYRSSGGSGTDLQNHWEDIDDIVLKYASDLATTWERQNPGGWTEDDLVAQVASDLFGEGSYTSNESAALAQNTLANVTQNDQGVSSTSNLWVRNSASGQLLSGNGWLVKDETTGVKYYNNDTDIPYVTEEFWKMLGKKQILVPDSSRQGFHIESIDQMYDADYLDAHVVKSLPVIRTSNGTQYGPKEAFLLIMDDGSMYSYGESADLFDELNVATKYGKGQGPYGTDLNLGRWRPSGYYFRSGADYIPYDNYLAYLHKGERVLTAQENASYDPYTHTLSKDQLKTDKTSNELAELSNDLDTRILKSFNPRNENGMYSVIDTNNIAQDDNTDVTLDNTESINLMTSAIEDSTKAAIELSESLVTYSMSTTGSLTGISALSDNTIAGLANQVISKREGNYNSINYNDNGALSIGKIQWHGNNARNLLQSIYDANPSSFTSIANQYGASNLVSSLSSDWSHKILTKGSAESNAISAILNSATGKSVQDQASLDFINKNIELGKSYGLTDPAALIFFADLANQYGPYGFAKTAAKTAVANGGTLDALYQASISNGQYTSRRKSVYEEIKGMNLNTLSIGSSSAVRNKIVQSALSTVGLQYLWGGEMYDTGMKGADCSGLVYYAYNEAGEGGTIGGRLTASGYWNRATKISNSELQPGDPVFSNFSGNKPGHIGIYIGNGQVVHAKSKSYGIVQSAMGNAWTAGRLLANAAGGYVDMPSLSLLAEGGYPEYVISTDPQYAYRSKALMDQAAADIGVAGPSMSGSSTEDIIDVYIDVDGIIDAVSALTDVVRRGFKMFESKSSISSSEVTRSSNKISDYV